MPHLVTSFDSVVLAAIAREISALVGSRVLRVIQPAPDEIVLELGARPSPVSILCSINARWARVHVTEHQPAGGLSTFGQLVRHRLDGARLTDAGYVPFERILSLTFRTLRGNADLIVEIMGRHSNVILAEEGFVIGSLKTVPKTKSTSRAVIPGSPYIPPPADRPSPAAVTKDELSEAMAASREPLAQRLVAVLLGLSPALAMELVVRASLDPSAPASAQPDGAAQLWKELQALVGIVQAQTFEPTLYLDGDEPVGFAPFPYQHLARLSHRQATTMSVAVAAVLGRWGYAAQLDEQRTALLASVRSALARVMRKEAELRQAIEEATGAGSLRQHGELLLTYASQVPAGASEVTLSGYAGAPVTIPLNPALSAVENAQQLFKRYKRVHGARPLLEGRLADAESDRAYLESVQTLIAQAATRADLDDLRQELAEEGYLRRPAGRTKHRSQSGPRQFTVAGGGLVLVGRTNRENDALTFRTAAPDDLWLHARGVPGAHVILKTDRVPLQEGAIKQAASIAAFFSQARGEASAPVDYLLAKHVRKPKGAKPGLVAYTHERTVQVSPAAPDSQPVGKNASPKSRRRSRT